MKIKFKLIHAVALAVSLAGVSAQAADVIWDGGGGDGIWTNAVNWDTGMLPGSDDLAYIQNGDTVSYADGMTNTVNRQIIKGGSTLNFTGGYLNSSTAGNTVREIIGQDGASGTVNQSGGLYDVGHGLRIGFGGSGTYNLSGGTLNVYRDGTSAAGAPVKTSVTLGSSGAGILNITGGSFLTRFGLEMGAEGIFEVNGAGADQIELGTHGGKGDGKWYQFEDATLKVGISPNGVTPIVLNDHADVSGVPQGILSFGSVLDVSFIDGAMETNSWPVLDVSQGSLANNGMVFADSMGATTNDWGFIVSNNTLYVGYGLDWPAGGEDIISPPSAPRNLYWSGNAGDDDAMNPTNWVNYLGDGNYENEAVWPIYSGDTLYVGEENTTPAGYTSEVTYVGGAISDAQGALNLGYSRTGIFNNEDTLSFGANCNIGNGTGHGILNVIEGTTKMNIARLGLSSSVGEINVSGGTLTLTKDINWAGKPDKGTLYLGYDGTGTGIFHISGGRVFTRAGVYVGVNGQGIFSVEGSAASEIGIGSENSLDGFWAQSSGSILKARIDAGGITPINIVYKGTGTGGADVNFFDGSILDLGWTAGVTNFGSFDIMTWAGELVESNLTLASSVDTNIWSFAFVDANEDGTNDTLRATAYGETANGTPSWWLHEYELTEADDEVDNDNDGMLTWEEYIAGTNPTNTSSVLEVTLSEAPAPGYFVITWQSDVGRSYDVYTNLNLTVGSRGIAAPDVPGKVESTSITSSIPANVDAMFINVDAKLDE